MKYYQIIEPNTVKSIGHMNKVNLKSLLSFFLQMYLLTHQGSEWARVALHDAYIHNIPQERKKSKKRDNKTSQKEAKWNLDNARALTALVSMQQLPTYKTLRYIACRMSMAALFFFVSRAGYTTCVTNDYVSRRIMHNMYTRTYIQLRLIARTEFESSLGEARMHRACCL